MLVEYQKYYTIKTNDIGWYEVYYQGKLLVTVADLDFAISVVQGS